MIPAGTVVHSVDPSSIKLDGHKLQAGTWLGHGRDMATRHSQAPGETRHDAQAKLRFANDRAVRAADVCGGRLHQPPGEAVAVGAELFSERRGRQAWDHPDLHHRRGLVIHGANMDFSFVGWFRRPDASSLLFGGAFASSISLDCWRDLAEVKICSFA